MKTLDDIQFKGKRVLMRVDFNVPLDKERHVKDDLRIRAVLPSIRKVLDSGGRLILASHLGRPKGKVVEEFSLRPAADYLAKLLGKDVPLAPDCVGPEVVAQVSKLADGDVLMLENLRFHPEEEKNDPEFSKKLAQLADIYVNEAFSASHRAHASVEGVTRYLPVCAAGYQLQKEIEYFKKAMETPQRPLAIIVGGAKVSTKIGVLRNLITKTDYLIIGGAMANTFFKAQGKEVGKSLVEDDHIETAATLLQEAKSKGVKIYLPVDAVTSISIESCGDVQQVSIDKVAPDTSILDIGSRSLEVFESVLQNCRTIVWNGPMGVFETPPFNKGTFALAEFLGALDALTVVGGGDSAAAIKQANLEDKVSYVSTGGGAFLEMLEGIELPGIVALESLSRKPLVAANWKMFKTVGEALSFVKSIQEETGPLKDRDVVIAPPFTALKPVRDALSQGGFNLSAQNCHFEEKGAFTGEISPGMLKDIGCEYVIVGHSERRQIFGETDEMIRKKASAVFQAGMTPIICIGEVLDQREQGKTFEVVGAQVAKALEGLSAEQAERAVVAYEPVWAIGTGKTATPAQAQEVHAFIRKRLESLYNKEVADRIRILYGGSVKPDNVDALMAEPDIDGALVGGASLEVGSFKRLIQFQSQESGTSQ